MISFIEPFQNISPVTFALCHVQSACRRIGKHHVQSHSLAVSLTSNDYSNSVHCQLFVIFPEIILQWSVGSLLSVKETLHFLEPFSITQDNVLQVTAFRDKQENNTGATALKCSKMLAQL